MKKVEDNDKKEKISETKIENKEATKKEKTNEAKAESKETTKKEKTNEVITENKNTTKRAKTNQMKAENKKIAKNSILEISAEAKDNLNIESKRAHNKENNALLKEEDLEINHEKLEKIKNEIKNSKKESKDKVKKSALRKKIVRNLVIAILIIIYFLFIDLGINSIPITVYMLDLKTFAVFIAIISIVIFERAYKKDENYIAIHGIEMVVVGIETLLLLQLYSAGNEYFNYILLGITLGMIVYYLLKCLVIYIRYKVKGK